MKLTDDILERYLAGELSPQEMEQVEQRLGEDAPLQSAVRLTKAWEDDAELGLKMPSPDFATRVMIKVLQKRFSFRELVQTNTLGFLSGKSGMFLGAIFTLLVVGGGIVFGALPSYYPDLNLPTFQADRMTNGLPVIAGLFSLLLLFLLDRWVLKRYFAKDS
ncbi:MAG TPA: hypothetical protein DCE41_28290 [Cytophagales bacterium]|nr:hypothetical protein [Cytophagales bacterium]HAA18428.1 hypothetical protein [Cytophagales bacterium]HAP61475.1 hypothetical protein [Cytophagales bacterium]